jgi:hypothetical protein
VIVAKRNQCRRHHPLEYGAGYHHTEQNPALVAAAGDSVQPRFLE